MQYINQNPLQTNQWSYTNNTDSAQNIIVTLNGGDGALSKSTWVESNWTQYWNAGARGVSVQCFINDTLQEVAQGGLGNPQSVANQKVYSHTEGYKCGRYWYGAVKWCDRAVYVWGSQRAFPRGGSGDTKSFALNLGAGEVLKIVFVGGANIINTLFNGSVSLSFIPQIAPVIPEPESPEVEPSPKPPETELPEVDSNEKPDDTEQGGDSSQENTESENTQQQEQENTENENPPIVEPESPQEQEPTISAEMREEARKLTEAMQSYQTFLRENKDTIVAFGNMGDVSYQLAIKKKYSLPLDTFCDSKFLVDLPYIELWYGLPPVLGKFEQDMLDCGLIPYSELTFAKELQELTYPQLLEIANGGKGDLSGESEPNPETQEPQPEPEVEAPQEPQTQEEKLARIQEIKQNALVSEFLSFKGFFETLLSDEAIANQVEPVKLVYGWFREWILNPLNLTRLDDIPASHDFNTEAGANIAMAKWVAKIENINEIYADLQGKGFEASLNDFKNFIICIMMGVNGQRDGFESERNRYVEIYAMPEIRALIDELEKLEAEV